MSKASRREFLRTSAQLSFGACCAAAWGTLGARWAFAQSKAGNGRTLVFVNLFGGNDTLNSFTIPYSRSAYYDIRPTLAVPEEEVLRLNADTGLNPSLSSLHQLYQSGDLAVLHGVGDPLGTRSHFTSQLIQSLGIVGQLPDGSPSDPELGLEKRGWIGRLGDLYILKIFHSIRLESELVRE